MSLLAKLFPKWCRGSRRRSFALNELDRKLEPYLDFDHGFFIEAGANDGVSQSNTLYFERYRGWKGLLIEPIPELAAQCRRNRPACIVENYALVPFDHRGDSVEMRYCNLMSLVKGAMKSEEADLAHIQKGAEVQRVEPRELRVPAQTLTAILDRHQPSRIDFFSLDVEGGELSALQGLDLARYRPIFILVEARTREEIDDFLAPYYDVRAVLSHHDVLYQSRNAHTR